MMTWIVSEMGKANLAMFAFCIIASAVIVIAAKTGLKLAKHKYATSKKGKRKLIIAQENLIIAKFQSKIIVAIPLIATAMRVVIMN